MVKDPAPHRESGNTARQDHTAISSRHHHNTLLLRILSGDGGLRSYSLTFRALVITLACISTIAACSKDTPDQSKALAKQGMAASSARQEEALPAERISASSQLADYGPTRLLQAATPGWHALSPPTYPEELFIDFGMTKEFSVVGFASQLGYPDRSPKKVTVSIADSNNRWLPIFDGDLVCPASGSTDWVDVQFGKAVKANRVKIVIHSNCGANFLTLRGLRFK